MRCPSRHVAYIPALQVCKGFGIHGVVARGLPFAAGIHLGTYLNDAEGCCCAACSLHKGNSDSEGKQEMDVHLCTSFVGCM